MHRLKYQSEFELDDPRRTVEHSHIIKSKPFLKKLYLKWYSVFAEEIKDLPEGKIIEIGSGGGFLKEVLPQVITSDILPLPNCDMTFPAGNLPFDDKSLAGILMLNVLHHIPRPEQFFINADKKLINGGKIIMIETANTVFSRFIYKKFHHEDFDTQAGWELKEGGPLSASNQALPWIIFERDKIKFMKLFPHFVISRIKYHTPLLYILSGGVSHKALVPGWTFGFFAFVENIFSFLNRQTGMFETIVIRKQ